MKDTLSIGAIAGMLGTIVMHLLSMLWAWMGWEKITSLEVSGLIFLTQSQLHTPSGWILAGIVHLTIGAAGGVAMAYVFRGTGRDYWWLKGLGVAATMLLLGMGLILPLINVMQLRTDAGTTLAHATNFALYGLVVSFLIARYMQDPVTS